jgi:hypothetical protein
MHNVTVKREMNHSVEDVWKVLDDYGSVYTYNPGVKTSEILGAKQTGLGAQRECKFYDGSSLKETIFKFGPLGWLMATLLMQPMLTKTLNGLVKGLDDYMTSGQRVGESGELLAA